MLRFKFPVWTKQIFLFVVAGITRGFAIILKDTWKIETIFFNGTTQNFIAIDSHWNVEQAFILGAGAWLKRFSLGTRFKNGNGMASATLLKSTAGNLIEWFEIKVLTGSQKLSGLKLYLF